MDAQPIVPGAARILRGLLAVTVLAVFVAAFITTVVATNVRLIQDGDWIAMIIQVVVIGMMAVGTTESTDAVDPN